MPTEAGHTLLSIMRDFYTREEILKIYPFIKRKHKNKPDLKAKVSLP